MLIIGIHARNKLPENLNLDMDAASDRESFPWALLLMMPTSITNSSKNGN